MTKRNLGVAVVFLFGCATGGVSSQLVVPKASAQQAATLTKWQYHCDFDSSAGEWEAAANRAGSEGWELVSLQLSAGTALGCFKRPKM